MAVARYSLNRECSRGLAIDALSSANEARTNDNGLFFFLWKAESVFITQHRPGRLRVEIPWLVLVPVTDRTGQGKVCQDGRCWFLSLGFSFSPIPPYSGRVRTSWVWVIFSSFLFPKDVLWLFCFVFCLCWRLFGNKYIFTLCLSFFFFFLTCMFLFCLNFQNKRAFYARWKKRLFMTGWC